MESDKLKCFDGSGDAKKFITKIEVEASLKEYTDEKKAQHFGTKLLGPALDVYMRLTSEEKKDFTIISDELLKEFERGQLNRDDALYQLERRNRLPNETALTYAYKIIELVKLAYPTFQNTVIQSIAKDYFVRRLNNQLQVALKAAKDFSASDIKTLAKEAVRLEIAGIGDRHKVTSVSETQDDKWVNTVVEKVFEKVKGLNISSYPEPETELSAGYVNKNFPNDYRVNPNPNPNRDSNPRYNRDRNSPRYKQERWNNRRPRADDSRRCRSCNSSEHFVRNCPKKYCQSCGLQGHDQNDRRCEKYQP